MKKIFITVLLFVSFSVGSVQATTLTDFLPGGKNYLDPNNFSITNNSLETNNNFIVKQNQDYTLTIPSTDMLGQSILLSVEGINTYYDFEEIDNHTNCTEIGSTISCQFTTSAAEESLYIAIIAPQMGQYYAYYGMEYFQLEEGNISTTYEPYVLPHQDTTSPEFNGSGAYIKSYQSTETIQEIISNHVVAVDEIDGDITNQIVITSDTYTGNEQVLGEYNVELYVEDSSGNSATFLLTIMVKDEIAPEVVGPSTITVNVNNPPLITEIISSNFVISDEYDQTVDTTILLDEYTTNNALLGDYTVEFEVTDDSLNTKRSTFTIAVVDTTSPVMQGDSIYTSYLSNIMLLDDILSSISFTDNYDDLSTIQPTIISDTYTGNETTPGTYTISLEMTDSSMNTVTEQITVHVVDDIAPSIGGPSSYSVSYTEQLTLEDILQLFTISDNVDSLSTSDIMITNDTFSTKETEIGTFEVSFYVKDQNNNQTNHSITITIVDDQAPIIYVDDYIVTLDTASTFNSSDALNLLLLNEEIMQGDYEVETLVDEYTGNETTPGTYLYKLGFRHEDGTIYEKEFLVQVQEEETLFNADVLPRNIVLYSMCTVVIGVVCWKRFKY